MPYFRPVAEKQSPWASKFRCFYCGARARSIPRHSGECSVLVIHVDRCPMKTRIQRQFPVLAYKNEMSLEGVSP